METSQGFDELLNQPEVRAQPPEQKDQQQDNEGDNDQILQITFSAVVRRIMMPTRAGRLGKTALAIFTAPAACCAGIRQVILATARKRIVVTPARGRSVNAPIDTARR